MDGLKQPTHRRYDRDVVVYREFTGLRNDVAPERFDPTDLEVATNVDIDKSKRIARRDGYTKRNVSPAHSLWGSDDLGLFVSGTSLLQLRTDFSSTTVRTGLTLGNRMSYCQVAGRTYFSNSAETGIFESGAARSWGLPIPTALSVTDIGGTLPAGIYQYAATYFDADGQESGAGIVGTITANSNSGFSFDIPVSTDPRVVSKGLYLTTPDGEIFFLAAVIANATASVDVLTEADILELNLPLETQYLSPPPAGQLVGYYKGRMFVAVGDTLYPSEPYAYELFDLRNYISLDGQITMLAAIEDKSGAAAGFFIGTDKSCGILTGSGPIDFQYVQKADYGAVLGAVDYVDGSLYGDNSVGMRALPMWLSEQGICIGMPNMDIVNLTRTKFSFPISGEGAALFIPGPNRYVAVSQSPLAISMHTEAQALTQYSNYAFNSLTPFNGTYLGASASGIFELVGDTDETAPIISTVRLAITDFGTTFLKALDRLYVGYRAITDMVVNLITDETTTTPYPLLATTEAGLHTARVKVGKRLSARYWQVEFTNPTGGDFQIDVVDVKSTPYQRRVSGRA
jgi:hypothetical protein